MYWKHVMDALSFCLRLLRLSVTHWCFLHSIKCSSTPLNTERVDATLINDEDCDEVGVVVESFACIAWTKGAKPS